MAPLAPTPRGERLTHPHPPRAPRCRAGSLVESVPAGPAYRAAQGLPLLHVTFPRPLLDLSGHLPVGLLLLHVTIVYMVKSVVLARSAHGSLAAPALRRCRPRHALTRSERPTPTPRRAPRARRRRRARRARLRAPRRSLARNAALLVRRHEHGPLRAAAGAHRRISFSSLCSFFHRSTSSSRCWGSSAHFFFESVFLFSQVPFFEPLLGLIGGLLSGPINFLLPIALYLGALCRDLGATARESDEAAEASLLRLARLGRAASTRLPLGERIGLALIVAFVLGTMVVGTYSTVTSLAARWRELGGPFACHPLVLVNNSDPCGG